MIIKRYKDFINENINLNSNLNEIQYKLVSAGYRSEVSLTVRDF